MTMSELDLRPTMYNYRLRAYDDAPAAFTDDNARDYMPQHPTLWNYYVCCRRLGDNPQQALVKTLKASLGESAE